MAVVKPAQTGEPPGPAGDLAVIRRLSGVTRTHELARFPDPLSPEAAARAAGRPPLDLAAAAVFIKQLQAEADLVLVEGAGGLLVRYDPAGAHDRGPGRHAGRAGAGGHRPPGSAPSTTPPSPWRR